MGHLSYALLLCKVTAGSGDHTTQLPSCMLAYLLVQLMESQSGMLVYKVRLQRFSCDVCGASV